MKKSVEILGLPIISITEGRELGMSKTLLIDAKNGKVAAITIEDEDWYRGVKLIPYESVIAIGDDAVTITNSENILKLDDAGDYETLLDENIRVIGTKAITKTGSIQGKISELFIGDDGTIEKCEITAPDGTSSEVMADQISIFGMLKRQPQLRLLQHRLQNLSRQKHQKLQKQKPSQLRRRHRLQNLSRRKQHRLLQRPLPSPSRQKPLPLRRNPQHLPRRKSTRSRPLPTKPRKSAIAASSSVRKPRARSRWTTASSSSKPARTSQRKSSKKPSSPTNSSSFP